MGAQVRRERGEYRGRQGAKERRREERKLKGRQERRVKKKGGQRRSDGTKERRHKGTVLLFRASNIQYNQLLFHHPSGPHDNCPGF